MPAKDLFKASVSVSSNFIFTGLRRVLAYMLFAGAVGALIIVFFVALIAAIIK